MALFVISVSVSRRLRQQVKENKFLAEHDPLTDLPNRSLFHQRAQETVDAGRAHRPAAAIAILDLDRFKEINDTLGHESGDQLLTLLAQRLADHTRPQDAVARLGGDEFGLVLSDVGDAEEVLRRLRDIIEHEVEVSGLPLSVESSIGFVLVARRRHRRRRPAPARRRGHVRRQGPARRRGPLRRRATTTTTPPTSASSPSCAAPSTPASWSCTTSPRPP